MILQRQNLTENQQYVLTVLRMRCDDLTANATATAWTQGERYYLDSRNRAGKGIRQAFVRGNNEAKVTHCMAARREWSDPEPAKTAIKKVSGE